MIVRWLEQALYLGKELDFNFNYETKVAKAATFIQKQLGSKKPIFGVTLGSGLGDLADAIENATIIPYEDIPHFPTTTVAGHDGKLIIGDLEGVPVIGLKGRKHFYEGATEPFNNGILRSVFAVNVLANLGVENYFVTNAAGGLNLDYNVGDIMVINSHINTLPNPLLGEVREFERVDGSGPVWRFPPMNGAYHKLYTDLLVKAGASQYVLC